MKRFLMMTVMAFMAMTLLAQENNYIVKTKHAKKTAKAVEAVAEEGEEEKEEPQDFIGKNFRYVSMCDWKEGMRFMVIPDKKDMVIKTFGDSITGQMVSSLKLRHKIMVYKGLDQNHKGLHERVNFVLRTMARPITLKCPQPPSMTIAWVSWAFPRWPIWVMWI